MPECSFRVLAQWADKHHKMEKALDWLAMSEYRWPDFSQVEVWTKKLHMYFDTTATDYRPWSWDVLHWRQAALLKAKKSFEVPDDEAFVKTLLDEGVPLQRTEPYPYVTSEFEKDRMPAWLEAQYATDAMHKGWLTSSYFSI